MMLSSSFRIRCFVGRFDRWGQCELIMEGNKPMEFGSYQAADTYIQTTGDLALSPVERYEPREEKAPARVLVAV